MTAILPLKQTANSAARRLGKVPSRLGLGCASLGSRVDRKMGLRALTAARENGVNWFDVAPAYGAGDAESLLGEFLRAHGDSVFVTTKVGIAPPANLGAMKIAYALGRPLIGAASGLRGVFRKISATRNRRIPLDATLIESSIEGSLKRLGRDCVDLYALHDPTPEDVRRDDVLRALGRVISRGQARRVGIAGSADACRAACNLGGPFEALQMSAEDYHANRECFANDQFTVILHSVFGFNGMRYRLVEGLRKYPERARRLRELGYDTDPARAASDLLLDRALALTPRGVVLASMFVSEHLTTNVARARRRANVNAPNLVEEILA